MANNNNYRDKTTHYCAFEEVITGLMTKPLKAVKLQQAREECHLVETSQ